MNLKKYLVIIVPFLVVFSSINYSFSTKAKASGSSNVLQGIIDDTYISEHTVLHGGYFEVSDPNGNGVLIIEADNIVVDGKGTTLKGNDDGIGIYLNGVDNVTIKNFVIMNYGTGIYVDPASDGNKITKNIVKNNHGILGIFPGGGVRIDASWNDVENNVISSNIVGLMVKGSNNFIKNNIISSNEDGIYSMGSSNYLHGNTITFSNHYGIYSSQINEILNNTISFGQIGIFLIQGGDIIAGNLIKNNNDGIKSPLGALCSGVEIYYNKIIVNGGNGIYLTCTHSAIKYNELVNNTSDGIYYNQNEDHLILGNISIEYNRVINNGRGIAISGHSDSFLIRNNIIVNNGLGIHALNLATSYYSYNIYHNNLVGNGIQSLDDYSLAGGYGQWNNSYPSGGNYWDNYTGDDLYNGPNQDITGNDGIGDVPFIINKNSQDSYPLMTPLEEFNSLHIVGDVKAEPNPQEIYNNVNISTNLMHSHTISGVLVNITDNNGVNLGNFSMNYYSANDEYYYNSTYLELGTYSFMIYVEDITGNWTSSSGSFFIRDATKPTISNLQYPTTQEVYNEVNISAEISDNYELTEAWINITLPNNEWINNALIKGPGETYHYSQSYDILGPHSFSIWVKDSADNWGNVSGLFVIKDTTQPAIADPNVMPSPQEIHERVNITASINDNYQLSEVRIKITNPDGTWLNETMPNIGTTYYLDRIYDTLGIYTFIIWTNDGSNNWNYSIGNFEIIDSTKPKINYTLIDEANVDATIRIDALVDDNYAINEVRLNYTDVNENNYNVSMNLFLGLFRYEIPAQLDIGIISYFIWVNDTCNNVNQTNIHLIEIKDVSAPRLVHNALSSAEVKDHIKVRTIVLDDIAVEKVILYYRNPSESEYKSIEMRMTSTVEYEAFIPAQTEEGIVDYYISAIDSAGNHATTGVYHINIIESNYSLVALIPFVLIAIAFLLIIIYFMRKQSRDK
jgi:parallel beta-helix repeat protein